MQRKINVTVTYRKETYDCVVYLTNEQQAIASVVQVEGGEDLDARTMEKVSCLAHEQAVAESEDL